MVSYPSPFLSPHRSISLSDEFEAALKIAMGVAKRALGITGDGEIGEHEIIVLDDRTPMDGWDGATVIEAIRSMRDPPTILDPRGMGMSKSIRDAMGGKDVFQDLINREGNFSEGGWLNSQITLEDMDEVCAEKGVGLLRVSGGDIYRIREKGLFPDVVYDEDEDHYYLNSVGVAEKKIEINMVRMKVIYWNCNGWGWGNATDKCTMVGRMIKMEGADMVCLTDTRLDGPQELWALGQLIATVERITGKV